VTCLFLAMAMMHGCAVGGEAGEGGEYGESEGGEGGEGGGGGGTASSGGSCNDANEACGAGASCGGESATMLPGANCLNCHTGGEAGHWTLAGTVFTDIDGGGKSSGATITVTDAKNQIVTMTSNSAGNFYTTKSVSFPVTAEVEQNGFTTAMGTEVSNGGCNSCHACDGAAGGKLYAE